MTTYFVNAGFPGVEAIGRHGDSVGVWRYVDVSKQRVPKDGEVYVFGAVHPGYGQVITSLPSEVGVGFLFSSSIGEVDLEPVERKYLRAIVEARDVDFVLFGDRVLGELVDKGLYAPYPISLELLEKESSGIEPDDLRGDPAITLLNPSTLKKNALNQVAAVKLLENRGYEPVLHTVMDEYVEDAGLLGVDLEMHEWLEDDDYWSVLKGSDLNLCVSWAETFSYQTLEAAYTGVPVIGSMTVDWLPDANRCFEPNDPEAIACHADRLLREGGEVEMGYLETVARWRNEEMEERLSKFWDAVAEVQNV